jgi:hypothetical protein
VRGSGEDSTFGNHPGSGTEFFEQVPMPLGACPAPKTAPLGCFMQYELQLIPHTIVIAVGCQEWGFVYWGCAAVGWVFSGRVADRQDKLVSLTFFMGCEVTCYNCGGGGAVFRYLREGI